MRPHRDALLNYAHRIVHKNFDRRGLDFILTDGWTVFNGYMERDSFAELSFSYLKNIRVTFTTCIHVNFSAVVYAYV